MGKILYLECQAGISGDMTVAALLDLGADRTVLEKMLCSLPVSGFEVSIGRVKKAGVDCCDFAVHLSPEHENHDHDMQYLHGHGHGHEHAHGHEHSHTHSHRSLPEISAVIDAADMTPGAKKLSQKIFSVLAEAEAKAHNVPEEEVHFHEVGAVDSIVDILSAAVCLDNLAVDEVVIPYLCEGMGTVRCQHGILPIPVPAVANIIREYALPVKFLDVSGEFVTPTGAAIAAVIRTSGKMPELCRIHRIGMGAGKRQYERPSILRAMLLEEETQTADTVWKLESNIDDCTGEMLGFAMEKLFAAGAKDVSYMPVYMKKQRPGWLLTVICTQREIPLMEEIIFRETTTIGIRKQEMERTVLARDKDILGTEYGDIQVKICRGKGVERVYPEYESVAEAARKRGLPFVEVYQAVQAEAVSWLSSQGE